MTLTDIAQYISDGLELALILRLLSLRLHSVYRVFCAFLIFDLCLSGVFLGSTYAHDPHLYRSVWLVLRPVAWALSLWMVYALLDAMLANLPGILRASRKVLNIAFVAALAIALVTAKPEYSVSGLAASAHPVNRILGLALVLERAISSAALLALIAIVAFVVWFPVQMPKNLAVFGIGFAIFFLSTTTVLLALSYMPYLSVAIVRDIEVLLHAACFAYWLLLINRAGETTPVRIGHSWGPAEQRRLIGQLEAMNDALLRAARR